MNLQLDTQLMPQYLPGHTSREACSRVEMVAASDHSVIAFTLGAEQHLTVWLSTEEGFVRWLPITVSLDGSKPATVIDFDVIGNVGQGRNDGTIDLALVTEQPDGVRALFYWPAISAEASPEAWRLLFPSAKPLDFPHSHPLAVVRLGVMPLAVRRLITGSCTTPLSWEMFRVSTDSSGQVCTGLDPLPQPGGNPLGGPSRFVLAAAVGTRIETPTLEDGAIMATFQESQGWYSVSLMLPHSAPHGRPLSWPVRAVDSTLSWPPGLCHIQTVLDTDLGGASFLFTQEGDGYGNATITMFEVLDGRRATGLPCSVAGLLPASGAVRVVPLDPAGNQIGRLERMRPDGPGDKPAQLVLTNGTSLRDPAAASVPLIDDVGAFCACRCGVGRDEPTSLHVLVAYAGGGLELFTQDSLSEQWTRFPLTDDNLLEGWHAVSSYSTRILVRDERGAPAVGSIVALRPKTPCFALINGVATHLTPMLAHVVAADGAGAVNLVQPLSALGAAMIDVSLLDSGPVPDIPPGSVLSRAASHRWSNTQAHTSQSLNPMTKVTARLARITGGADIRDARASDGTKPFAHLPLEHCDEASTALAPLLRAYEATLAATTTPAAGATILARTRLKWCGRRVTVEHADFSTPEALAPAGWLPPVGDMLSYLWTLVNDTVSTVVTELEWLSNGLANLVLTIGDLVWKATLSIASQAVELIDWALQKSLGISLDDLVNWLGQVFDWPIILRTQKTLKHLVGLHRKTAVDWIRNEAPLAMGDMFVHVRQCLQTPAPTTPESSHCIDRPGASDIDGVSPVKPAANGPDMLWGNTQLLQFSGAASVADGSFPLFDTLVKAVEAAGTSLKQDADSLAAWAIGRDFSNASPGELGKEVLALLGTALLDTTEAFSEKVVPGMGTAVDELMNQADQPLYLPVLSALYRDWINPGQDLTVLDAMTLVAAIAGHIGSELTTGTPLIPEAISQRILNATTLATLLDGDEQGLGAAPRIDTLVYGYSTLLSGLMKFGYFGLWANENWGPPAGATRIRVRVALDCASWLVSFGWAIEMLRRAPADQKQPYTLAVVFLFLGLILHRSKDAVDFHYAGSSSPLWAQFKTFFGMLEAVAGGTMLMGIAIWQTASTFESLATPPDTDPDHWLALKVLPSIQALSNATYYALSFERLLPETPVKETLKVVRTATNLARSLCPIAAGFMINDCASKGWRVPGLVSD
ncbi:hypothetical protein [Hydrogenophaga sp. PBL-H3]|uniref:hypothetical protein n=1 Tax=Hydrogenophaga sp. PBL-H3 TaxID=434010 RepID=UPI00131FCE73|nr:hypothetical protein [Hydrogenophaga sp. PBL-H3]QHE77937.1 hypothetical protein F9Z45_18840 [Hydrogenophaga sp. PBL-H3]QHE82361.1 hypothetical protein F9Z44_18840 [Hydrogenophaga sp. PBL-H3]